MPFTSEVTLLAGLIEIELPSRTVRLCDGGFLNWPARGMFTSQDVDFGTIESVDAIHESISDMAPSGSITLLPSDLAEASTLFLTNAQGSPIRFWFAEANRSTGLIVGTPELQFDGLVDQIRLRLSRQGRFVVIEFMSAAERLFMVREGNVLSPRFHQTAWPGEQGFDHATGAGTLVPWGVSAPGGITSGPTFSTANNGITWYN